MSYSPGRIPMTRESAERAIDYALIDLAYFLWLLSETSNYPREHARMRRAKQVHERMLWHFTNIGV